MNGLSSKEVAVNRKKYGSNELVKEESNSFWKLFIESLGDPIIKILLIALGIKIIFLFSSFDWFETIGIVAAILIASLVSSISEYGSEKAFKRLQQESLESNCKVKRDGKLIEIYVNEVVVDDIVHLTYGDKIPADGHIISGSITVDESTLNGEAKEINKQAMDKVYRGTIVCGNEAIMKVTSVGEETIYGKLAKEIQSADPESPLKLRLHGLAKIISKIGYIGAILVSISYLFSVLVINNNFDLTLILNDLSNFRLMFSHILYALTLSVTIIVVAVPEGLPMMITLVLSLNMKKMLKNNVLVRRLVGIETAGSINVLLTDKTGTLTKGIFEVIDIIDADLNHYKKEDLNRYQIGSIIKENILYNNSSNYIDDQAIGGNSTDKALTNFLKEKKGVKSIKRTVAFNSNNKYSLVELEDKILIKGACEKILPYCKTYYDKNGTKRVFLNQKEIKYKINEWTEKGIRVIALANNEKKYRNDDLEGLTFIGIILIKDEIREETREAINLVDKAHIKTIMITGDAKETAVAIGKEINLIKSPGDLILTSDELNGLSDEEIKKNFSKIKIIARALPSDKSRLVKIAEDLNLVVGMTGDGINDAPALKKANVGFAMGSGTEVSKDASDIVILDNNFLSITKAILFGRTIFKSIRKFIIFQLTVNLCALVLSIVGPFIGVGTPITIVQMLWLNMIMDTFAAVAFSYEAPLLEYMEEQPKDKNEPIINRYMYGEILWTGLYSAFLCIIFLKAPFIKDLIRYESKYIMTGFFALFIFIDIFNAFNARTSRLNILANILKNKIFIIIILFIVTVQIYLIYYGGDLFRTYGLSIKELIIIVLLSSTVLPVDMIRKLYLRKRKQEESV